MAEDVTEVVEGCANKWCEMARLTHTWVDLTLHTLVAMGRTLVDIFMDANILVTAIAHLVVVGVLELWERVWEAAADSLHNWRHRGALTPDA